MRGGSQQSSVVIVSLTPMPLRADSRTLKQASSVVRLGYSSIVVEGPPSTFDPPPLFKLISSIQPPRPPSTHGDEARAEGGSGEVLPTPDVLLAESAPPVENSRGSGRAFLERTLRVKRMVSRSRGIAARLSRIWLGASSWLRCLLHRSCAKFVRLVREARISEPARALRHWLDYVRLYVIAPLRVTPKAKLYYLHAWYQFPAVYLLCLRYRAKFVYDAHDFYSNMVADDTLSHFWRYWILPCEKLIERICVSRAAAVVTVNEGIAQLMEQRFGRKPTILRNAHDERLDRPVSHTIRETIGLGSDELLFVCIGQWKSGRAVSEAILALGSADKRYHLAFLGSGYPSYAQLLDEHKVAGRVHFLPPVQPTEVVPFVSTADAALILYHPIAMTYRYSLPNGFFQPIAAGLPILYPELPEIRKLAERHGLGVAINPLDPSSITAAMQMLGEDAHFRMQIAQNVMTARSELSWQRDEEHLDRLLESLLASQGQRVFAKNGVESSRPLA